MCKRLHVKYQLFFSDFNENCNFLDRFSKRAHMSRFMKISPVRAELFHADGRTDRQTDERMDGYDEANSRFS